MTPILAPFASRWLLIGMVGNSMGRTIWRALHPKDHDTPFVAVRLAQCAVRRLRSRAANSARAFSWDRTQVLFDWQDDPETLATLVRTRPLPWLHAQLSLKTPLSISEISRSVRHESALALHRKGGLKTTANTLPPVHTNRHTIYKSRPWNSTYLHLQTSAPLPGTGPFVSSIHKHTIQAWMDQCTYQIQELAPLWFGSQSPTLLVRSPEPHTSPWPRGIGWWNTEEVPFVWSAFSAQVEEATLRAHLGARPPMHSGSWEHPDGQTTAYKRPASDFFGATPISPASLVGRI